ncbi:RimJ/RimL family protein N-acetyltransferase [Nonomuraea thailandensis]|uniref:RimJ/RimL family protein N-acetyltransferase n=1 Tax=Nonomuraea thailandensis TaxID=1188745 RepID=A0A9X2G8Y0_9ACTN|nr:GNAT family protein [Nonomuraea thailandensis]MCP2353415.1 RimJ/RimL family protein N-acetyltransferase [Nonomuraea thailandensis]
MSGGLAVLWPLLALRITTPRLELAIPDTDDLLHLAQASGDLQPEAQPRFQQAYLYEPSPQRERHLLQRHWRALAHWRPESWNLQLAIRLDGIAVGLQNMWAADFATARTIETGSWITRTRQGHGYGTEARAAVLELAFAHLGAVEAHTSYVDGNTASERVSRKLGYTGNGRHAYAEDGRRVVEHRMLLDAAAWAKHRMPGITVDGARECLELFGLQAKALDP